MLFDVAGFFADGVQAVYGGQSAMVILDMPDQSVLGDMQVSTEYLMTYPASDLPGLKYGDSVSIEGVSYQIKSVSRIDDGAILSARMMKV